MVNTLMWSISSCPYEYLAVSCHGYYVALLDIWAWLAPAFPDLHVAFMQNWPCPQATLIFQEIVVCE